MKRKKDKGLYAYLDMHSNSRSTEAEIAACRADWVRLSKAKWRKEKRATVKSLTISFNHEEYATVTGSAKEHSSSRTAFCKEAVFGYINRTYIVADRTTVHHARQFIEMTFNEVLEAIRENAVPSDTGKTILAKIFELERMLVGALCFPPLLADAIAKAVREKPEVKDEILKLIEAL